MNIQETIENKIIDLINTGAGGRVIISKVENADKDLKIEKRSDYKTKPLYIKIYSKEEEVLEKKTDSYICIASFDFVKQDIADPIMIIGLKSQKVSLHQNDIGKYFIEELEK